MRLYKALLLLLLILMFPLKGLTQKVGLVMSGGGAKGLAHIGVLKALEEHRIPIDYVTGTSMGGIVGGFYAAGYSPEEIEKIVLSDNFVNWVNGDFDEKYNYYYSKKDENSSILSVDIALDSTLSASLNSSLASDRSINFVLAEKLAQASQVSNYDFDKLYVPFRVVAADIFTQKEVVLKNGTLNNALRATLTVPFFYKPIKIDKKYLFDGGIYNNFPVDVMKKSFNPEVIIGSNVSSKKFDEYPYKEDEELINNSLLYSLLDNSNPQALDSIGVYIEPNVSKYTPFDFSKAKSLIDSGYAATIKNIDKLKSQIDTRVAEDERIKSRNEFKEKMEPLVFTKISYYGFKNSQQKYLRSLFKKKKKEFLTLEEVKKGYFKLVSEDYFKNIYPNIIWNENEGYELEIHAQPKRTLRLEFGGTIATRSISQIFLGARFFHFNRALFDHSVNFYTGRFYQSAQVKSRINLPVLSQFYIEPEFTFNHWDYIDSDDFFFKEDAPTIVDQIDRKYGLTIGMPVNTHFKLEMYSAYINNRDRFSNNRDFLSTDTLDILKLSGWRYGLNLSKNSLNRRQYPNSGQMISLSLDYFDMEENYFPGSTSVLDNNIIEEKKWLRARFKFEQYVNIGSYSQGYHIESVFSNQPFFSNYTGTLINTPSFFPLQDSKSLFLQKFRAHNYLAGGFKNIITVNNNLDFRIEGFIFKALKNIKEVETQVPAYDTDLKSIFLSGTAGAVYHSPIGPISFSFNYYDDNETKFGALLHIGYLLYNKRSLE